MSLRLLQNISQNTQNYPQPTQHQQLHVQTIAKSPRRNNINIQETTKRRDVYSTLY